MHTHFEIAECAGDVFLKGNPGVPELGGTSLLTYLFHLPSASREGTELAQQPHSLHLCQGLDRQPAGDKCLSFS